VSKGCQQGVNRVNSVLTGCYIGVNMVVTGC